jgi:hypothetical protein
MAAGRKGRIQSFDVRQAGFMPGTKSHVWSREDKQLLVQFDDDGTVAQVWVINVPTETLTERIRRWLGL